MKEGIDMEGTHGQVALEMFLALALALLAIHWLGSYVSVFEGSVSRTGINEQQKVVAMGLARMVNTVCVSGANVSIIAPCIADRGRNIYYQIKTGQTDRYLVVSNAIANNTNATVNVSCGLTLQPVVINTQCAQNQVLCIGKKGDNANRVMIKQSVSSACT